MQSNERVIKAETEESRLASALEVIDRTFDDVLNKLDPDINAPHPNKIIL